MRLWREGFRVAASSFLVVVNAAFLHAATSPTWIAISGIGVVASAHSLVYAIVFALST